MISVYIPGTPGHTVLRLSASFFVLTLLPVSNLKGGLKYRMKKTKNVDFACLLDTLFYLNKVTLS